MIPIRMKLELSVLEACELDLTHRISALVFLFGLSFRVFFICLGFFGDAGIF